MRRKKSMEVAIGGMNLTSKLVNFKYIASITNDISQLLFDNFFIYSPFNDIKALKYLIMAINIEKN
jgi:hypothetical protein